MISHPLPTPHPTPNEINLQDEKVGIFAQQQKKIISRLLKNKNFVFKK